jgi:cardiolipin synthase
MSTSVSTQKLINQDRSILDEATELYPTIEKQFKYIADTAGYPVYNQSNAKYFSTGEDFFAEFILKLNSAKKYIFIEFFIIEEGILWDTVLSILKRKAHEGLDIRLMYDDMGSLFTLPKNYYKTIRSYGIKCVVFNRFYPILSLRHNNRDHRKIIVIDGQIAFTGGCNLADEYINGYEKFGRWKDAMIMISGMAVHSFTVMFLQSWKYFCEMCSPNDKEEWQEFKTSALPTENICGYVQPYGDSPLDGEQVGQNVYINLINSAKKYVYIMTPYFVVGDELISALCLASKNGLEVKIITPYIPDKGYVHAATRSYYELLLEAGIKVYEYLPGFIHSKVVITDDIAATIGTINFDYRSLYLHFECGVLLCGMDSVLDMKKDFLTTLNCCTEILEENMKNRAWILKLIQSILRVFSPLM